MIELTLFELSAIMGLPPIGDIILSNMEAKSTNLDIDVSDAAYSHFIANHMGSPFDPITKDEHIAFLFYWLNAIVFCSWLVQIQQGYLPLAALLHDGRKLWLAKLVIAQFY